MRRVGHLFERIVAPENLRLAFHQAALSKRGQPSVRAYAADLDDRIESLDRQLAVGTQPLGRLRPFVIRDPKKRIITPPCFEERVLHHAIMNLCEPWFDRWLIDDTFACSKGKGREAAVLRATYSRRHEWCVHLDLRKYFDSIPHARLSAMLRTRFKDARLLELFDRIIGSFRGAEGVGLPIGSLTSQHFANFYLGPCDRFVKESLGVPGANQPCRVCDGRSLSMRICSNRGDDVQLLLRPHRRKGARL